MLALLAELVREHRSAAILVSHDPASTEIADRVVHIRDGRVSEERQGESETAVVGAGGWLRIPEETLRAAGIHDRARIVAANGSVELHAVAGRNAAATTRSVPLGGARGVPLLARGVSRRYGAQVALDDVTATFEPGELTVVVGPSGSGKSTLLALLTGMDVPDDGEIRLGDTVLSSLDRTSRAALRRDHIAVVGQAPGLSGFLSARENVELGLALRGVPDDETDAGQPRRSRRSDSQRMPTAGWICSRRVSASASRSPVHSQRGHPSSWPTSRPPVSTQRRPSRSGRCSSSSPTAPERR